MGVKITLFSIMGLDVYIIPMLEIDELKKDENLEVIVGSENGLPSIKMKGSDSSILSYSDKVLHYGRIWENSFSLLGYLHKRYKVLIGADGFFHDGGYCSYQETMILGKYYSEEEYSDAFSAHEREKKQLKKQYKKEADADLQRVFKDADSRILTPRGPNGSLRSIDKKAAQRLKKQQEMDAAWKEYGLRDDSTKDKEMNALWSMRNGRTKKDKAAKYHSMQSLFQKHRDFHHKHNKWAHYDLQNALKDADSRILTPRGPNGSLRAIDRKYKKRKDESQELRGKTIIITESQLRDIIQKLDMGIL